MLPRALLKLILSRVGVAEDVDISVTPRHQYRLVLAAGEAAAAVLLMHAMPNMTGRAGWLVVHVLPIRIDLNHIGSAMFENPIQVR